MLGAVLSLKVTEVEKLILEEAFCLDFNIADILRRDFRGKALKQCQGARRQLRLLI